MANRYGTNFTAAKTGTGPQAQPDSVFASGKRRSIMEAFVLASQASGDKLFCGTLPIGAVIEEIVVTTDTSLATATLAFGSAASGAKYSAATTYTATDTPTPKMTTAGKIQAPLTAPEDVWATIGTAALPASGNLSIEVRFRTRA